MPLLRIIPPRNFIFRGVDFGSTIALDRYSTEIKTVATLFLTTNSNTIFS